MPMPLAAGTGPATLAGNLVVQNAEALSGVVLLELAFPGVPAFFAGAPSVIDLKTGGYTGGSPEDYAKFIRDELAKWGPVVKASGAKLD